MRLRLISYAGCTALLYAFYVPAHAISSVVCYLLRLALPATYAADHRTTLKTLSNRL